MQRHLNYILGKRIFIIRGLLDVNDVQVCVLKVCACAPQQYFYTSKCYVGGAVFECPWIM
jgi:hypothetical protein